MSAANQVSVSQAALLSRLSFHVTCAPQPPQHMLMRSKGRPLQQQHTLHVGSNFPATGGIKENKTQ